MADLDFRVNADTSRAQANLRNLESSLAGVTNAFRLLTGVITAGAIVNFADSVTNLKNRLLLLSDSQAQANAQFQALVAISTEARTDLGATGDLYFRIARATKELGISQAEAAQITESLAKAMTSSGLSAAESAGPLLQLGQALQSGVFQGDELRSILEGLPPVARALADQLGVPIGALRKMGSEGQITSQQFVLAMRKARDAIEQDFAKTVPTIGQAFNQLKNQIALAFSNFETQTQTGQNFALAIEYIAFQIFKLSKNIDQIIGPLGTFIQIVGTLVVFNVVSRTLGALGSALRGIIGYFGRLGAAFSNAKDFLLNFGSVVTAVGGGFLGFGSVILTILKPLGMLIQRFGALGAAVLAFLGIDKFGEWFKNLGKEGSESRNELEAFRKEMAALKGGLDQTAGTPAPIFLDPKAMLKTRQELEQITINYQRQNLELQKRLQFEGEQVGLTERQKAVRQALFDLENNYLNEVSRLTDMYREKSQSKNKEDQASLPIIQEQIQRVTQSYQAQIGVIKDLIVANFDKAEIERQNLALSEFSIRTQIDGQRKLREIQDDIAKTGMSEIQQKYYDIARASEDSARSAIEAENSRRRSLKLAEMTADEERQYYERAAQSNNRLASAQKQLYEQSRTFQSGWNRAFKQYIDDATNAAKQAERLFSIAFKGIEDALVDFVKTGRFEWKNFVADITEELLRSQIRQLLGSFAGALGLGNLGGGLGGVVGTSPTNPMYVIDVGATGRGGGGALPFGNNPLISGGGFGGGMNQSVGLFGTLTNAVSGLWNFGKSIVGGIGDLFGGFFATGGMIPPGRYGIVGERGPEYVSGPASVTPMQPMQVTYNINAVDAMSFKALVAQDPAFIHAVAMQGAKSIPGRY